LEKGNKGQIPKLWDPLEEVSNQDPFGVPKAFKGFGIFWGKCLPIMEGWLKGRG